MHFDQERNQRSPEHLTPSKHHLTAKTKKNNIKTTHYPFLSSPQRFQHHPTTNPGPGTYEQLQRQRHTSDYHVIREKDQWGVGKEFMWIVSKGREPFEMSNPWKANIGPGKYEQSYSRLNDHSGWAKKARFNYEKRERKVDIGPGCYGTAANTKAQPAACSAFKSKSDKSFMDSLLKQQIKLQDHKINPELEFSSIEQEIQEGNLTNTKQALQTLRQASKHKKQGSPVFLSKIARLPTPSSHQVGPGSYTLSPPLLQPKPKRLQTDNNQELLRSSIIKKHNSSKVIGPGPGAYEINRDTLNSSNLVRRAALGVILKDGRFKNSSQSKRSLEPKFYDTSGKTACLASDRLKNTSNNQPQCCYGSYGVYTMLRRMQDGRGSRQRLLSQHCESK